MNLVCGECVLFVIAINNILVKVQGQILSKMWKDEVMGVDQLKDRGSKFSGAHLYPDGSTNSRSSFSQVGENDAADIYIYMGKKDLVN